MTILEEVRTTTTEIIDFIVALVDALIWPALILALVLMLRKPLADLIPLVERIRFHGLEVNFFRERLGEVVSRSDRILPSPESSPVDERILADFSSTGAIIESWLLVEREMMDLAESHHLSLTAQQRRVPQRMAQALARAGIIDDDLAAVVRDLREVRNIVAHTPGMTPNTNDAEEYAATATRIVSALRQKGIG